MTDAHSYPCIDSPSNDTLYLQGPQFWPGSTPIHPPTPSPVKRLIRFINSFSLVNLSKRRGSDSSITSTDSLTDNLYINNEFDRKTINRKKCARRPHSSNPPSLNRKILYKSRHHSIAYFPRHGGHSCSTPDKKIARPISKTKFIVNIHWLPHYHIELSLPRTISLRQFYRTVEKALSVKLPSGLIVLYHTEKFTKLDELRMKSRRDRAIVAYCMEEGKVVTVDEDREWRCRMVEWDTATEVTLVSLKKC
ncbi:8837_t:CDS:1 [Paraglomus brasilianum]|uniref:8837_t:CDS:1 n=1 Tax=Paraglomus brasilianum TaxID=144538 RepID=A0A9N8WK39_9GLOM|nr:8837_t:CDS:1 [Paraglomus brasilianum]